MKKNFFDLVNSKFFSPLSGPRREVNYALLKLLNEEMQGSMEYVDRSRVIDLIADYFTYHPGIDMTEDDTDITETDVRKMAAFKVAYFEKTGWLSAERGKDFKVAYQMEPAAIEILTAMDNVENNDMRPVEYTGYVYDIYSRLENFDITHSTEIIEQLLRTSRELNNSLRSINKTIKSYLDDLLNDDTLTLREIFDKIYNGYQDNVVAKAFYNLRVTDNPSKYKNKIIAKIDTLLYERMGQMLQNYLDVKATNEDRASLQDDAQQYIVESLNSIKEQFENIESSIAVLDRRNTKYLNTATSRVKYLMDESVDFEGRIHSILKTMYNSTFGDDDTLEFPSREFGKIDENSLYTYTRRRGKVKSQITLVKPTVSAEDLENERERLRLQVEYSIKNINEFICRQLDGKTSIEAKDVALESDKDLYKLFIAQIYAGSEYTDYDVKLKDDFFEYNTHRMTNFTIYRR